MSNIFDHISDDKEIERLRRERAEEEWRSAIDKMIDEAQREGKFDNLPGQGKPLNLKKNPYAEEQALAYELLQNNNYTLPWIADRRELLEAITAFRGWLRQAWLAQEEGPAEALSGWPDAVRRAEAEIAKLNKDIAALNPRIPVARLELFKLALDRELDRARQ